MKRSVKRALALMLALMLAIPGFVLAEDDAQVAILPEAEWALEDPAMPDLEIDPADELPLDGLELPGETPAVDGQDEAIELPDAPEADAPIELPDGEAADEAAGEAEEEGVLEESVETNLIEANAAGFEQTQTVDGVAVTVKAAAGAFPAGATLSVKKASKKVARRVDKAIAQAQEQTVLASYTFNIRVLDAEGNALRPAEGFDVELSFALAQVPNANAAANVYHIGKDGGKLNPEALDIVASTGSAVTALVGELALVNVTLVANDEQTRAVKYIDPTDNNREKTANCAPVQQTLGDGWYAVTQDTTYDEGMTVTGKANLILCDGTTLTGNDSIWVQKQASLTIWAQSTGKKMGKLVVSSRSTVVSTSKKAAIGGMKGEVAGRIIINGGDIKVNGGGYGGAGIGGGYGAKSGYTRIEINGGKIEAQGHKGSGIGSGENNGIFGTIEITGGTITAGGTAGGSGIGASNKRDLFGTIIIAGGRIIARGGKNIYANSYNGDGSPSANKFGNAPEVYDEGGAGIAGEEIIIKSDEAGGDFLEAYGGLRSAGISGEFVTIKRGRVEAKGSDGGAGIGGHKDRSGGTITIEGGTVIATGHDGGAGIGGGSGGESGTIIINGGTVTAESIINGAGIGSGGGKNCHDVTITGGTVTATGGSDGFMSTGGAGIGSAGGDTWKVPLPSRAALSTPLAAAVVRALALENRATPARVP